MVLNATDWIIFDIDRVNYDKDPCPHLADLRTRTQAAITLVRVAQVEIKANAILRTKRNKQLMQDFAEK